MDDRSRAILITVLAVVLLMFPGFGGICFGLFSLFDSIVGLGVVASTRTGYFWDIFGGICFGLLLIIISIIVIILAFRKRPTVKAVSNEPIPPPSPYVVPPSMPEEVTPRTPLEPIPPEQPFPPEEPLPPEQPQPPAAPDDISPTKREDLPPPL